VQRPTTAAAAAALTATAPTPEAQRHKQLNVKAEACETNKFSIL
jgi:hypothetical protein